MSEPSACTCQSPRRLLRELSLADAATLRQLRAAALGGRALTLAPKSRVARRIGAIVAELESLAGVDVSGITALLREQISTIPDEPQPTEAPVSWTSDVPAALVCNAWLREAHRYGYTLEALGEVAGVTRERIRQLVAKAKSVAGLPPVVGVPCEPEAESLPWPTIPPSWRRWPRPTLTEEERADLVAMHRLGSQLRGQHAPDDPRRRASEEVTERIADLIEAQGFTYKEVADILGVTVGGVRMRLKNHGFKGGPAPSQRGYKPQPFQKGPKPPSPIRHGTPSGYNRCVQRSEGSCEDCREAKRGGPRRRSRTVSAALARAKLSPVQQRALADLARQQQAGRRWSYHLPAGIATYRALCKAGLIAERGHDLTPRGWEVFREGQP